MQGAQCGSADSDVTAWMHTVQTSVKPTRTERHAPAATRDTVRHSASAMYSEAANRYRRQSEQRKTCPLFLLTDYMMWKYMTQDLGYVS